MENTIYDFSVKSIDRNEISLSKFKGKRSSKKLVDTSTNFFHTQKTGGARVR